MPYSRETSYAYTVLVLWFRCAKVGTFSFAGWGEVRKNLLALRGRIGWQRVAALKITMVTLIVISSLLLILTVLMHKGRGGGLSDMFGGGISSTAGSSGVAEKNLNRITIGVLVVWSVAIIAYGLMVRFGF